MGVCAMLPPPAMLAEPMSWRGCAQSFPGRPDQVRAIRAFLARFLAGAPGSDDAVILISELATNACTHSASSKPRRPAHRPRRVLSRPVHPRRGRGPGQRLGRPHRQRRAADGLYLLRELSATCGARRGEDGWITWFTVNSPPATSHPPQP